MLIFLNFIIKVRRNIYQGFKILLRLKRSIEGFSVLSQAEVELAHWAHSVSVQYWD